MSEAKIYVDGILFDWGDRLFYAPYRSPKVQNTKIPGWAGALIAGKPARIRAQIARTTRRAPEVMVKITSKGNAGRGMKAIGAHIDYISRNGRLELEDQDGLAIIGRADLVDLKRFWAVGGHGIGEVSHRREAFNVMFGMPAGTPGAQVRAAVRDFLKTEFDGYDYIFVLHEDTGKPHVHVAIKAAPFKRGMRRLNPRKADLARWREGFAERLRAHGIEANATPRRARGEIRRPVPQSILHMAARDGRPINRWPASASLPAIEESHRDQFAAWAEIAKALSASPEAADKVLAGKVMGFGRSMPLVRAQAADGRRPTLEPATRKPS